MTTTSRPDIVIIMTDEERAIPPYEVAELAQWRQRVLSGRRWFDENGVSFQRHYTGSLACVPSRPTLFTGQFPDVHGVTQTDGLGKNADDSRMRWLQEGEVPTLGHWFRAAGYDTVYKGKWHITHADLIDDQTGAVLATNDSDGVVDNAAVQRYLEADRLDPFGFSGWVGPEPHGAGLANAGVRRDQLIADQAKAWLADRYARRLAGDADAKRPFVLVASFVNPHDIVLFPAWARRGIPLVASSSDPPTVSAAPTADEDLHTKPAVQTAYRASYPSGYGPAAAIAKTYEKKSQEYRDLYYRLHAEVDGPLDQVRRAVTEHSTNDTVLVRTSDHGEMLGAHGGLHQKWMNFYDEVARVPFVIAGTGSLAVTPGVVTAAPTSHVDLLPTLLSLAGIDREATAAVLAPSYSEFHPLAGHDLTPFLTDPARVEDDRYAYMITRDNMLDGDSGASAIGQRLRPNKQVPLPLRIQPMAHVGTNVEALVARVPAPVDGRNHLWKIVRSFDDPAGWTTPGVRHLSAKGPGGEVYRDQPLDDQWELYDLDADPIEAINLAYGAREPAVFAHLTNQLAQARRDTTPPRNRPWPYEATAGHNRENKLMAKQPPKPALALRRLVTKLGMHPEDGEAVHHDVAGRRALLVATNHAELRPGKATGVFASELTVPYYAFLDAGMSVDVASPLGGRIPVDPQSLKPVIRTAEDDRYLGDPVLLGALEDSLDLDEVTVDDYDVVFLAGGWGAAFDFGFSDVLATKVTEANAAGLILGGVCHGPLGLRNALGVDGKPLVAGRNVTGVTDKQVKELGIESTPHHPETELRRMGAEFESATRFRDAFANHWVVDGNLVTGQNQNAAPMVAREMMRLVASQERA